jgi:hypothetical protein
MLLERRTQREPPRQLVPELWRAIDGSDGTQLPLVLTMQSVVVIA